jgi:tRNA pseudouridine65 synthase
MKLRILYENLNMVAIDKPARFHSHSPEDCTIRISNHINCLKILRRQLDTYLYPAHRLDVATSGILLFAKNKEMASHLCHQFEHQLIQKYYLGVVRGSLPTRGLWEDPLKTEKGFTPAKTYFETLQTIELPIPNKRYQTTRLSLLHLKPITGKYHQIRRHSARAAHPIIGDSSHGDTKLNGSLKDQLKINQLMLRCSKIILKDPFTQESIQIKALHNGTWHKIFNLFNICPTYFFTTPDIKQDPHYHMGLFQNPLSII